MWDAQVAGVRERAIACSGSTSRVTAARRCRTARIAVERHRARARRAARRARDRERRVLRALARRHGRAVARRERSPSGSSASSSRAPARRSARRRCGTSAPSCVRARASGSSSPGRAERWFTPAFRESAAAQRILDDLGSMSAEGYAACCEALASFDFRADLRRIAPPTLVALRRGRSRHAAARHRRSSRRASAAHDRSASHAPRISRTSSSRRRSSAAVLAHLQERAAA